MKTAELTYNAGICPTPADDTQYRVIYRDLASGTVSASGKASLPGSASIPGNASIPTGGASGALRAAVSPDSGIFNIEPLRADERISRRRSVVKAKTKCDQVVDRLMAMIADGEYKPGDKLPTEAALQEMFGVSRVTVREAVKRLNTLNLLDVRQGDGTYVKKTDAVSIVRPVMNTMVASDLDISTIYDARIFVEIGSVRLAARKRTDEDIKKLLDIIHQTEKVMNPYDAEGFSECDNRFHELIGEIGGNPILLSTYTTLKELLKYYRKQTNEDEETAVMSLQHHRQILGYIEQGNEYLAGLTMEQHIDQACKALLKRFNMPDSDSSRGNA